MTSIPRVRGRAENARRWSLVWIDGQEALVLRCQDGRASLERVRSEVPSHHRATGRVRHDPAIRHGGGGPPQTAGESHRLEHLTRFVELVASRLPEDENLAILGPGTVRERLERSVRETDRRRRRAREIVGEASAQLTSRQLVARLRELNGIARRRRTVGAYRWTGLQPCLASGEMRPPRRVVEKHPEPAPDGGDRQAASGETGPVVIKGSSRAR